MALGWPSLRRNWPGPGDLSKVPNPGGRDRERQPVRAWEKILHLSRQKVRDRATLIGVSRPIRIVIASSLSVMIVGGVLATTTTAASAQPTARAMRTYPMPPRSVPEQLTASVQAKLPALAAKSQRILGDDMDQSALMPVQVVSALYIQRAFRQRLGAAAWRSALRISWRESRLLPNVVNDTNSNGTNDWGLFQLNDGGTLQYAGGAPGTDVLRPRWNARAAARIVSDVGWSPWGGMLGN